MRSLSRVDEQRRRAGRSHGRRNLARHMARFPHAGNHHAPRHPRQQFHRPHKARIETIGQRAQGIRFQRQDAAAFGKVRVVGKVVHATLYAARNRMGQ